MTEPLPGEVADAGLEDLLVFIRDSRGFDLTGYKRSSLSRRIRKRMHEVGVDEYEDYRDRLETSGEEFRHLFNTILINVTSFFRDADAWNHLRREVLPDLLASIDPDQEIRVWSAGSASGEEAYSLAMVFAEALGIEECQKRVKIYGTDVDEEALRDARTGIYPARSVDSLAPDLRDRYFEVTGDKVAFRSDLRRRVIFGRHDITRDAPISRLDLLVCRNTLMYFNVEAQSQIVDRFHFALRDTGYLFLGKVEMLLSDSERFEIVSIRQRIFRRRTGRTGLAHQAAPIKLDISAGTELGGTVRRRQLRDLALDTAPYGVLGVDTDGTVVVINSQVRAQFGLSSHDLGRPLRDLEISYRPVELRSLIDQSHGEHRMVRVSSVERRVRPDEVEYYDILVQPLWAASGLSAGVAIIFIDATVPTRLALEVKRHREELETAYEELQSTNEELETTNEELQSSNEELETMNEEMRIRSTELDEVRGFLESVLSVVTKGVVVLDHELRVQTWNRGAEELWGLRADEVRQRGFFTLDFGLPTTPVRDMVHECLESRQRTGPMRVRAINRIGRPITCSVICSALDRADDGVVLVMDEVSSGG